MKATGLVAEFNPLHNGHVYMMKEARRITKADAVVVAMSGNFVQRGEPAIINKWRRTENALLNGADIVFEVPAFFCLQDAGRFASAGIKLLEALNCINTICCGCGTGDAETVKKLAETIKKNRDIIENGISQGLKKGFSYPVAREKALLEVVRSDELRRTISKALNDPNDILAIEYMMASESSEVMCIDRVGAGYNDSFTQGIEYQSASGIRDFIKDNGIDYASKIIGAYIPNDSLKELKDNPLVFKDDTSDLLRYSLINSDYDSLDECPSGGEGLGHLFKDAAILRNTTEEIIAYAKSKRYTYTRLSRLCMQILLGIDRRKDNHEKPEYLRLLGFTEKGRELLSEIKKDDTCDLPIITNINKESPDPESSAGRMLRLDIKAADIYNLICGNDVYGESDYKKMPVIIGS